MCSRSDDWQAPGTTPSLGPLLTSRPHPLHSHPPSAGSAGTDWTPDHATAEHILVTALELSHSTYSLERENIPGIPIWSDEHSWKTVYIIFVEMFSTWLQAVESVVSWVHNCFLSLWICTNFQALQNCKRAQSCHLYLPRTYCMIILYFAYRLIQYVYFWNQHHLFIDATDLKFFVGRGWMIVQESPINFQRQDKSGLWHTAL